MLATKDTWVRRKRQDDVFEDLVFIGGIWILIPDVGVVTAGEPDTDHDVCLRAR